MTDFGVDSSDYGDYGNGDGNVVESLSEHSKWSVHQGKCQNILN